ncbi:MAG: flagellar hook-basal body protein [Oscillospiraceae bacterium]|jgi:flagellar basal body rod protein FlgG|nr:flagellar hook-basal body protein [Oscillospiraceae bacterium]
MYEVLSIAATGLRQQQRRLDVIADNLANVNTAGFKSGRVDFRDALYTAGITQEGKPYTPEGSQQKGHGVLIAQITKDMSVGSLQVTGSELDLAIEGDVYLSVQTPLEGMKYTKAGNMYIVADEVDDLQLVTSNGHYILDEEGNFVNVPRDIESMKIDSDGKITFVAGGEEVEGPYLGVYAFENIYGLSYDGDSLFSQTDASGEAYLASFDDFNLRQGALEMSNTSMAQEMQLMIRSQRAFQLASRALTTGDQMEGLANSMKQG